MSLEKWRFEIDGVKNPTAYRKEMKRAIDDNRGLKRDLDDMLVTAWKKGCAWAATDFAIEELGPDHPKVEQRAREIRKTFPDECPWTLVELAGYNPRERKNLTGPRPEVWPAEVAECLNQTLNTNYPECGWNVEHEKGPAMPNDEIHGREPERGRRAKRKGRGSGRAHQSMAELGRQAQEGTRRAAGSRSR